jgi:geranylgeranyl diphosphate synthase type II
VIENTLKEYSLLIEKRIDEIFPERNTEYKKVIDAARYSLLLGGKRIRPVLMLEFCKLCGGEMEDAIDFAIALEMIHTYSLIHDDLPCMDNDDLRRGKPSCHIKFGEDIALLAGDTLLTTAFSVASNANIPDDKKVKAISVLAKRAGAHGMIGGQVMDLAFEKEKPDIKSLYDMYILKTGALLSAAAEIGAIIAGADEEAVITAANYALNLGQAFQIIDDILDITGDEKLLGKPIGSDTQNDKTTVVSLIGLEKAKKLAKDLTYEAIGLLDMINKDNEFLKELTLYLLDRNY